MGLAGTQVSKPVGLRASRHMHSSSKEVVLCACLLRRLCHIDSKSSVDKKERRAQAQGRTRLLLGGYQGLRDSKRTTGALLHVLCP